VIRTESHAVVEFDGPVLELMTDSRTRFDQRLAGLGPDVLGEELDEREFLRRLREDDPTRFIGDALLDQRNIAGIGNVWKAEACFAAQVDPWRALADVSDAEALAVVQAARTQMSDAVASGGLRLRRRIYDRAGLPCPRCRTRIRARGQGDDNRTTFWCPRCQG
jgi:endonuclease-8